MPNGLLDLLEIGKPTEFINKSANSVLDAIKSQLEMAKAEAQLTYWTNPANADPNMKCRSVFLMRCDGMSDDDIAIAKAQFGNQQPDEFIFDAQTWAAAIPEAMRPKTRKGRPPKASKNGWELMAVGQSKIVTLFQKDLKMWLGKAMLIRGHDWVFKCQRMAYLEDARQSRPTQVWNVIRIR